MITITKIASDKILYFMKKENKEGYILRVSIQGGGCSGLNYILKFDKNTKSDDIIIKDDNLTIACDPKTIKYIKGLEIDYETKNLLKTGFIFNNPNSKTSCSCGESFSI